MKLTVLSNYFKVKGFCIFLSNRILYYQPCLMLWLYISTTRYTLMSVVSAGKTECSQNNGTKRKYIKMFHFYFFYTVELFLI